MEFRDNRIYSRRSHPNHGQFGQWEAGGEFEHGPEVPSASDYGSDYALESGEGDDDRALHAAEPFQNAGDTAVEAVKNFFGLGPRNYLRSDERIQEDVSEVLLHDRRLDASGIEVSVHEGVVTLEGLVPDRASKWRAEDGIDQVPGLKEVRNLLRVWQVQDAEDADFPHSEDGLFGENGLPDSFPGGRRENRR